MLHSKFSKKVALRYLLSRRSEAFISIISVISVVGVALGVMVLNIVMAIMTGFELELREKIIGANSHIVVRHLGGSFENWEEVQNHINEHPEVFSATPFTYNQALVRADNASTGLLIRGILPDGVAAENLLTTVSESERANALIDQSVPVQRVSGEQDNAILPPLVVGKELARTLGLRKGDKLSILSSNVGSSPFGMVPKFRRFVVSGIYNSGLVEYEAGLAYTNLKAAQTFFRLGSSVAGIEVRIKNPDDAGDVAQEIVKSLQSKRGGFYAQPWTESNKALWDALRLEKKVYFIVLLLLIILASFSIVSTLIMVVLEKRKDIAILRTMGASAKEVGGIFSFQGSTIGAIGTLLGLALGFLGCKALQIYGFPLDERIFQMSTVPVRIVPLNFILVGISAFLICCVSTIYPARRASRLDPVQILRFE